MRYFILLFFLACALGISAQRVLLFEKMTSSKAERILEGQSLRFKLKGDKFWQEGFIREMRPDIQALVINDRFVLLEEIDVIHRGKTIAAAAGYSLMTFGVAWSGFAVIGYNTDGDPDTQYSELDALVTATSLGTGYLLNRFLGTRRFRTGKNKRLRIVDLNF